MHGRYDRAVEKMKYSDKFQKDLKVLVNKAKNEPEKVFCDFLGRVFRDQTEEGVASIWNEWVRVFPWEAFCALISMRTMIEAPPEGIGKMVHQCGWIVLVVDEDTLHERPGGDKQYLEWIGTQYAWLKSDFKLHCPKKWTEYFEANFHQFEV